MGNGRWREPLKDSKTPCHICGPHRTVTFSVRPFEDHSNQVDSMRVDADPVARMIDWALNELPPAYKSIMFSHYGGRYGERT
jgi:hypothetical protein